MRHGSVILCVLFLTFVAIPTVPAAAPRPHIVIFLADDLGWNDVGYHGSEIPTANIDALAAAGTRLAHLYSQTVCSPSRSSLMTGRYPFRQGLQSVSIRPWATHGLPLKERTLAAALHEAGYWTAIVGKWHLGLHSPAYLPRQRGFDHHYGSYTDGKKRTCGDPLSTLRLCHCLLVADRHLRPWRFRKPRKSRHHSL